MARTITHDAHRLLAGTWVALVALLGSTSAANADPAAAEALFREGRKLLDDGRVDEACVKLGESQAQDPSSGTLINLALCHERQGKLATAWAEYTSAARLAAAQGKPDRAEVATRKGIELEPRLPRLTVMAEVPVPNMKIVRGTDSLGAGALGTAVPVDPGSYVITALAPGYRSFTTSLELSEGESKTVEVPPLTREGSEIAPAGVTAPVVDRAGAQIAGWLVGSAGVVALGIGAGFGVSSLGLYRSAERSCPLHRNCSSETQDQRDRAETHAWLANVALAVGVVGTGIGAYLILTARRGATTAVGATPTAHGAALRIEGRF